MIKNLLLVTAVLLSAQVVNPSLWGRNKQPEVTLTITSNPDGATILSGTESTTSPSTSRIRVPKGECVTVPPFTVNWISGAVATIDNLKICESDGKKKAYTVNRPSGIEGADIDAQYAVQLAQLALMRKQMALQAYMGLSAASRERQNQQYENLNQLSRALAVRRPAMTAQPRVTCTSRIINNFIYTDCR